MSLLERFFSKPTSPEGAAPEEINGEETQRRLATTPAPVLLDVREAEELDCDGFIPGSVHIPMREIETRLGDLDRAKPMIVYCAGGVRSYNVCCYLMSQGFEQVANLRGGIHGWRGEVAHR